MPRLEEESLRRPGFVEGEPVVLADGQAWQLRRPVLRFVPADTEVGFSAVLDAPGVEHYDTLLSSYDQAEEGPQVIRAELALGRAVLLANYDLTPGQVVSLLRFGFNSDTDPEGARIREEVVAVATGRGKGRSDAGGE